MELPSASSAAVHVSEFAQCRRTSRTSWSKSFVSQDHQDPYTLAGLRASHSGTGIEPGSIRDRAALSPLNSGIAGIDPGGVPPPGPVPSRALSRGSVSFWDAHPGLPPFVAARVTAGPGMRTSEQGSWRHQMAGPSSAACDGQRGMLREGMWRDVMKVVNVSRAPVPFPSGGCACRRRQRRCAAR